MQRIDYSMIMEYSNKPFMFQMLKLKMIFYRMLVFSVFFFLPFYFLPYSLVNNSSIFKFGVKALFIKIFFINVTLFIVFYHFEQMCVFFNREINQFELISQTNVN
jgi:hypothetical protein